MDVAKAKKVVLITNIPNPYRVPLFNELNGQLINQGASLKVVFAAKKYGRRLFKLSENEMRFDYEFLHSRAIERGKDASATFLYSGIEAMLHREQPTHVMVSGFSVAAAKVIRKAKAMGYSTFVWSGTVLPFTGKLSWAKNLWRKWLARKIDGFICYGTKAKNYLVNQLGVEQEKVHISFNTVDTDFFRVATEEHRRQNIDKSFVKQLTSISYLNERKDNRTLIDLVFSIGQIRGDFVLNLIGDGEQRAELEAYAEEKGVSEHVLFHGFVQKNDLPKHLAKTDVFLFHTKFDIWGLVLNEAMAAGLPCLSSVHAGATDDLINEGETGFSVDFSNIEIATQRVMTLLDDEDLGKKVGKNASRFIQENMGLANSAGSIVKALAI